jgi:hypothetical protein
MSQPTQYFFIDECGDPEFFGKGKTLMVGTKGYQPLLILGLIETNDRKTLHKAVEVFCNEIKQDVLFKSIPSLSNPNWFLHAKNDHPEVRSEFFKFLRKCDGIRFHAVIARKNLSIFRKKHNNNASEFYFDVIKHLLEPQLKIGNRYSIYLSHKPKTTNEKLIDSIEKAIDSNKQKNSLQSPISYTSTIEKSNFLFELSVVDYFLWALQRYIYKKEMRFWEAIEPLVGTVVDLYDGNTLYDANNPFRLEKAKEFEAILL